MKSNLTVTMAASHRAVTDRQRSRTWAFMTRLEEREDKTSKCRPQGSNTPWTQQALLTQFMNRNRDFSIKYIQFGFKRMTTLNAFILTDVFTLKPHWLKALWFNLW